MTWVTGLGGVFFKSKDQQATVDWYKTCLGIDATGGEGFSFPWRDNEDPEKMGSTVWSPFKAETRYFEPSEAPFMVNFRVKDLDALLAHLKDQGVNQVGEIEDYDFGRFAWILDPDGVKIELWQPPAGSAGMDD